MIWLGGPAAAACAMLGMRSAESPRYRADLRRLWLICLGILAATILTGIVFPIGYDPLVRDSGWAGWFRLPVTLILVARNVLITALLGYVVWWVAGFVARRRPGK